METTDFADIMAEVAEQATTLDPDNIDTSEFNAIRRSTNRRLQTAWEYHFWPELGRLEQRFYRAAWSSATAYTATAEVYYAPTQTYYQALQASTNQAPANAAGVTNLLYWEETERSYAANDYSASANYLQGNRVTYGDNVYQLFVAGPVTAVLPTDATKWGVLTPFDQYISYTQTGKPAVGVVAAAWNLNPRTSTRATELNWFLTEAGVQINSAINFAWLDYRVRCPRLTGALWDATLSYAEGDQIYYTSTSTPANFFTANGATTPGDSPDLTPALWDVVELPLLFHEYLVHAVAGDWITGPGGGSAADAAVQLSLAEGVLEDQKSLLVGQQSQRIKTVVRTR